MAGKTETHEWVENSGTTDRCTKCRLVRYWEDDDGAPTRRRSTVCKFYDMYGVGDEVEMFLTFDPPCIPLMVDLLAIGSYMKFIEKSAVIHAVELPVLRQQERKLALQGFDRLIEFLFQHYGVEQHSELHDEHLLRVAEACTETPSFDVAMRKIGMNLRKCKSGNHLLKLAPPPPEED